MISTFPERWDQGAFHSWRPSGAAHCFAAWTIVLAGLDLKAMLAQDPTGDTVHAVARDMLGLTTAQAARLFLHHKNEDGEHPTVAQLKVRVTEVTGIDFRTPVPAG